MKRVIFYGMMIALLCGVMSACSGTKTDAKNLDGRWNIVAVNGDNVIAERMPFLEFDMNDMRLHGNAGCNVVNSTITLDDNDNSGIAIDRAVSTMMACPDMETENRVLRALEGVTKVKEGKNHNEMYLTDNSGNVLLVLAKQ